MLNEHWQPVRTEIESFRSYFKKFPRLAIEHAVDVDLLELDWTLGRKSGMWSQRGVYLIYDYDCHLLYVGMATVGFDKRIRKQVGKENAASIVIVAFPDDWVCFAPALEAFLIARLKPRLNKCGVSKYIPRLDKCSD